MKKGCEALISAILQAKIGSIDGGTSAYARRIYDRAFRAAIGL